ncbi:MAG TPA: citrate/2-methylcitrate synthase [Thermoplasmata archaeon]|jgi:citrate synthase|nr:citrate/2-methylcitrate synthase [Thermoplasmata archaeon]
MKADLAAPKIDQGLDDVYVKKTTICFIDGERGRLLYRGYDIRDLAEQSTFEETVFLLHQGRLPNRAELERTKAELAAARTLPPSVLKLFRSMPEHAPPMDVLRTAVSYLSGFDPERDDSTRAANLRKATRLVAQLATIVATYERSRKGQRVLRPDPRLGHAEDFLRMITGERPTPQAARMMDVALILYADHAINASTFAAIVAASTLADLHSTVVSAIAALKGPLHGGAIEAALNAVEEIGRPEAAEDYVMQALRNKRKIFGFGHRVYKTYDPRALILKEYAQRLAELRGDDTYFRIAAAIEDTVVRELASKRIYPNVDFYSGLVFHGLGIPTDLFTPVFALARVSGWTAQVMEYWEDNRLLRPLDWYVGPKDLEYVPLDERT